MWSVQTVSAAVVFMKSTTGVREEQQWLHTALFFLIIVFWCAGYETMTFTLSICGGFY